MRARHHWIPTATPAELEVRALRAASDTNSNGPAMQTQRASALLAAQRDPHWSTRLLLSPNHLPATRTDAAIAIRMPALPAQADTVTITGTDGRQPGGPPETPPFMASNLP